MFGDRTDAGRRLAARLAPLGPLRPVVLGLPRGGVPVAYEVARALDAPLDVLVVRKLGVPFQPELAMGAVGEGGTLVTNTEVLRVTGLGEADVAPVLERERREVERRAALFRAGGERIPLTGRLALIVDDGVATGSTARAACRVARALGAVRVVLAVPVAPPDTVQELREDADEVICLQMPAALRSVGQWYEDFSQTTDEQVVALLGQAASRPVRGEEATPAALPLHRDVEIPVDPVTLLGRLTLPAGAGGLVVFVHGSGSSRLSPRNRAVATALNRARLGTLLFDLLTPSEEGDPSNVFDIGMLAARLTATTSWVRDQPGCDGLRIGYFGASTGAAAALWAAADPAADIAAIVCRGGRPDLARRRLAVVRAPTLLVVGGHDDVVLQLNRDAQQALTCPHRLSVVPGATHLFEEPGALRIVAELARDWFTTYLRPSRRERAQRARDGRTGDPEPREENGAEVGCQRCTRDIS